MSLARYLVRFDDICPTMNWEIWENIERILVENNISPILAVVPSNRDDRLMVMPPRDDFWSQVRKWQAMGWTIALHGYEHRYQTVDPGLVGINARSEFAGLPRAEQQEKLLKAIEIFTQQGVMAEAWIAPGHSFDSTTVELLLENGIRVISDGYFWRPVNLLGATWIPQQIWRFRSFKLGTWTVCYHANLFSEKEVNRFAEDIKKYRRKISSLSEILGGEAPAEATGADKLFAWCWRTAIRTKRTLK